MPRPETKTGNLTVRMTDELRERFYRKASEFGPAADVLREIVTAFVESRLQIDPPVIGNWKEKLYVTREQD